MTRGGQRIHVQDHPSSPSYHFHLQPPSPPPTHTPNNNHFYYSNVPSDCTRRWGCTTPITHTHTHTHTRHLIHHPDDTHIHIHTPVTYCNLHPDEDVPPSSSSPCLITVLTLHCDPLKVMLLAIHAHQLLHSRRTCRCPEGRAVRCRGDRRESVQQALQIAPHSLVCTQPEEARKAPTDALVSPRSGQRPSPSHVQRGQRQVRHLDFPHLHIALGTTASSPYET